MGWSFRKKTNFNVKFIPLNSETISGRLLNEVETSIQNVNFVRTNLVKMAPLNIFNKLRYPTKQECKQYYQVLQDEIQKNNSRIVFLLGKQVSEFVLQEITGNQKCKSIFPNDFKYDIVEDNNVLYIGIHHPSHVVVYKRKEKDLYIQSLINLINSA